MKITIEKRKQVNNALRMMADQCNTPDKILNYGDVIEQIHYLCGIDLHSNNSTLSDILCEMMEEDYKSKQPFSSSVFVNKATGYPGVGYFKKLRDLGVKMGKNQVENMMIWVDQKKKFTSRKYSYIKTPIKIATSVFYLQCVAILI